MEWFFRKNIWSFEPAVFAESGEDCPNPGRGWYQLFSMDATEPAPLSDWVWCAGNGEQLALLVVDIGAFAQSEIGEAALENIRRALRFFRKQKKELLLRFVYDREGKGLEKEPAGIGRIRQHMAQLAPVLAEFQDAIFCIQGLFVGSWGEMHSSKFLTQTALAELWQQMNDTAPEDCFLAVRRPMQWRAATGIFADEPEQTEVRGLRLGLFNDGLLGSVTDLGTFPEEEREEACRFQEQLCRYVPNGGEAVGEDACGEMENAVAYFRRIRISYLNGVYDERVLSRWKNSTYQGENGYEYIGKHLGYRFVLTGAELTGRGRRKQLSVTLENRGFAPIYEACSVVLCRMEQGQQAVLAAAEEDLRQLLPGAGITAVFDLADAVPGDLMLAVRRKKDGRYIRLANVGAEDSLRIGRLYNER
jgi:hypothetical protein